MNWKKWIPLVLALVLGVVAAKLARDMVAKNKTTATAPTNMVKVVVAKQGIKPGEELSEANLAIQQVAPENLPEQIFTEVSALAGRSAKLEIVKGQTIVEPMVASADAGSGLQALIPPGMRAITIEVNEFSGLAGMIAPGCRVDLISTIQNGNSDETIARTVVENVKVQAVGKRVTAAAPVNADDKQQEQEPFRSVTLLATPQEAAAIELACSLSRPRLVLRSGEDNAPSDSPGVTLADLRGFRSGGSDPFASSTPQPTTQPIAYIPVPFRSRPDDNTRTVKVIRGGVETTVKFETPRERDTLSNTPVEP